MVTSTGSSPAGNVKLLNNYLVNSGTPQTNNGAAVDPDAIATLNEAVAKGGVVIQFQVDGNPRFDPQRADLDGALAFLLSIVSRAQLEGDWARFKACPGEDCGWAFYDYSRNQASAWCSMAICGSRAKARAYRLRRRPE